MARGELAERPPRHHDHLAQCPQPCRLRLQRLVRRPERGSALTSPYTLTGSVTLYAQWTANATDTVTFNSEGGSTVSSQSGLQGTTITLPECPQPCRLRLRRLVRRHRAGAGALTSPYTLTGSVTLYAQWTANATDTVTFNSEGGSTVGSQSGLQGTTITLPERPQPCRLRLRRLVRRLRAGAARSPRPTP